jgi:ribosome-associated toxin RatA of RatAB toxin-antitoxin module
MISLALTLVSIVDLNGKKFVTSSIYINKPPEAVWAVLTDPYKFVGRNHIKEVILIENSPKRQVLEYKVGVFFPVPDFSVTVLSDLEPHKLIKFKRIKGAFRDIQGSWKLTRQGAGTMVYYDTYIDTGFLIPQWMIQKAQMKEIPEIMEAFKKRAEHSNRLFVVD